MLHELDKELEKQALKYVRYAIDYLFNHLVYFTVSLFRLMHGWPASMQYLEQLNV
jgi:hypothetical protein